MSEVPGRSCTWLLTRSFSFPIHQSDLQSVCCLSITQIIRFALGVDRKATLMTSPNTHAHSALSNVYPYLSLSPYEPTGWDAGHGSAHSSTSETHRKRVACPLPPSHHRFGDFTVDMGHLSHGSGVSGVLVALLGTFLPPVAACLTQMTERTYFGSQFGRV